MSSRTSRPSKLLTSTSKRSGPYDANYQLKLAQTGIFLTAEVDENDNVVLPANHEDIMNRLSRQRRSLSPSRFTNKDFLNFQRQTERDISESETMLRSFSVIEGSGSGRQILSRIGGIFNNLKSFDAGMAMAMPDSYDGAPPLSIDHRVLHKLGLHIVPSTDTSRPAVPNFFIEGKSRMGRADVARRQATHYGAIGARGMMKLQSYPDGIPQYDGNAYSFTNTYQDGQLKMYATYATAPKTPDNDPLYYMTQLNAFGMTGDSDTFRGGATYYRNARDLAKEQRDSFIMQANQAAQQMPKGTDSTRSRRTTTTSTVSSMRTNSESRENRERLKRCTRFNKSSISS